MNNPNGVRNAVGLATAALGEVLSPASRAEHYKVSFLRRRCTTGPSFASCAASRCSCDGRVCCPAAGASGGLDHDAAHLVVCRCRVHPSACRATRLPAVPVLDTVGECKSQRARQGPTGLLRRRQEERQRCAGATQSSRLLATCRAKR